MAAEAPVTFVEAALRRRRRWRLLIAILLALVLAIGVAAVALGIKFALQLQRDHSPAYADIVEHFEHGSIGTEGPSGLPYWVWMALPRLFPERFEGRLDYRAFGFLYRSRDGRQDDLPIGIARRDDRGVERVWFNCAVCHTGTWRADGRSVPVIVPGMPSNNLDLYGFIRFLLEAAADERLSPERLIPAMEQAGARFGPLERLTWKFYVIPQVREGLILRRARLYAFIAGQAPWGPGRVDTFNPYKLVQMEMQLGALAQHEWYGASDFPSIFYQRVRGELKMQLHWDGNNPSLAERNLSAAIGAGVTPESVQHAAIERVAEWLLDLRPPPSPHRPDPASVLRGRRIYMKECATCHGYQDDGGYVFEADDIRLLGKVEPNSKLKVDPGRLDSYTDAFRERQVNELFAGTLYRFRHFRKTDGYANQPLDGLWLRGPYLHNGSIPTLRDLLRPPAERPAAFVRGIDIIDGANGGFLAPPCDPATPPPAGFCYDTRLPGNGNGGHDYGTKLTNDAKDDLLAYLLTF